MAYHAACSLQHGQKITTHPKALLKHAGFRVVEPADSHLCCGSAGTYNLMQPEISAQLKDRKVRTLEAKAPDIIAAGNIGFVLVAIHTTGKFDRPPALLLLNLLALMAIGIWARVRASRAMADTFYCNFSVFQSAPKAVANALAIHQPGFASPGGSTALRTICTRRSELANVPSFSA